ncbi:Rv1476 family membrane protein [Williamsia sp. SKLECPSW1]
MTVGPMLAGPQVAGTHPADVRAILYSAPSLTVIPDDVDLTAIESDLAADHVSAPADDVVGLEKVVAEAKAKGHDMYFVVLQDRQPVFTYYRDIATAIQKETGGTVIVFGPDTIGSASDDFSRVQLEQAQDNLTVSQPAQGAQQILDRMTVQTQIPWTVVTLVLVAVVAIAAVVARILQVRGRRATSPATASVAAKSDEGSATAPDSSDGSASGTPPTP